MKSRTFKFRPQSYSGKFKLRTKNYGQYNWIPRRNWKVKEYLHHVFGILHYKADHAPKPIRQKWKSIAKIFYLKHRKIL